jgi:hypothetical protein
MKGYYLFVFVILIVLASCLGVTNDPKASVTIEGKVRDSATSNTIGNIEMNISRDSELLDTINIKSDGKYSYYRHYLQGITPDFKGKTYVLELESKDNAYIGTNLNVVIPQKADDFFETNITIYLKPNN